MENPERMQAFSSPGVSVHQWLTDYFLTRAHLASSRSDFQCDSACRRPGCKNPDLLVQVSIVDLLGMARQLEKPVSAVYRHYCSLGLFTDERFDWIRVVVLKLKKPCPFLENDLCGIYPVRPLPCILFPEYLAAEGKLASTAQEEHFRGFLCLQRPLRLSPERAGIMARLKQMWTRETLFTSRHLFGHSRCYLDFSNLAPELRQQDREGMVPEPAESPASGAVPHLVLEGFFLEHLARLQPFAGVAAKIEALDNPETQEQFLRLLTDDLRGQKFKKAADGRVPVYRFEQGTLRARPRSLLPREYQFY